MLSQETKTPRPLVLPPWEILFPKHCGQPNGILVSTVSSVRLHRVHSAHLGCARLRGASHNLPDPGSFAKRIPGSAIGVPGTQNDSAGVSAGGVGAKRFNVGTSGSAFGMDNDTEAQILDLLLATDRMSLAGMLYDDVNGDGIGDGKIDEAE
jgi:hypothetical protein